MASLLSSMPPSTDCSAVRSCGGCRSNVRRLGALARTDGARAPRLRPAKIRLCHTPRHPHSQCIEHKFDPRVPPARPGTRPGKRRTPVSRAPHTSRGDVRDSGGVMSNWAVQSLCITLGRTGEGPGTDLWKRWGQLLDFQRFRSSATVDRLWTTLGSDTPGAAVFGVSRPPSTRRARTVTRRSLRRLPARTLAGQRSRQKRAGHAARVPPFSDVRLSSRRP